MLNCLYYGRVMDLFSPYLDWKIGRMLYRIFDKCGVDDSRERAKCGFVDDLASQRTFLGGIFLHYNIGPIHLGQIAQGKRRWPLSTHGVNLRCLSLLVGQIYMYFWHFQS